MTQYVWCVHGEAHAELAKRSMALVERHDPQADCWVYVDKDYGIDGQVIVEEYHSRPFMLMNVALQFDFLVERARDRVVFLDADAFMARPLPEISGEWDVAVTWRDNMGALGQMQPYNYGVVIVNRTGSTLAGWAWMCERISRMAPKQQKWYGNQIALRELCGPVVNGPQVTVRGHDWFDIRVKHLPCATWNWTPPDENPKQRLLNQAFVHFKGQRKDLADYYFTECWGDVA